MIKELNKFLKKEFPECDGGCNDCIFFKQIKRDERDKAIRHGKCLLPIKKKQEIYVKYSDELEWKITTEKKIKDWVNNEDVVAISNFCCNMRCFFYRRNKEIPEWRRNKNTKDFDIKYLK